VLAVSLYEKLEDTKRAIRSYEDRLYVWPIENAQKTATLVNKNTTQKTKN
jgi:hypothetical protein